MDDNQQQNQIEQDSEPVNLNTFIPLTAFRLLSKGVKPPERNTKLQLGAKLSDRDPEPQLGPTIPLSVFRNLGSASKDVLQQALRLLLEK